MMRNTEPGEVKLLCTMLLLYVVRSMYDGTEGTLDVIMISYIRSHSRSTSLLLT